MGKLFTTGALLALCAAPVRADEDADAKVGRQLQEVLRAHRGDIAACVAEKPASGEALLRFFVASDGTVGRVEVLKDQTDQPATALCVADKIRGWKVPELAGADTQQFVFPLVFKPEVTATARVVVPLADGKPGPIPNSLLEARVLLAESTVGKTQASLTRLLLRPTARQAMHRHPGATEVLFVVRGMARVRSGGPMVETATAGDVIIIPAGTVHNLESAPLAPLELIQLFVPGGPERAYNDRSARDGTITVAKGFHLPPGAPAPSLVHKSAAVRALPILGGKASATLLLDGVDKAVSIQRIEADPGAAVPLHQHDTSDELLFIVSGKGEMTVAGQSYTVKAGDAIHIPLATPHSLQVTEKLVAMQCYAPAGPEQRFKPQTQGAR